MDDLTEKLLLSSTKNSKTEASRNKHRLTFMYQKHQAILQSSYEFQIQDIENKKHRYYSIVQQPQFIWNSQQILQRSLLMEEKQLNGQHMGEPITSNNNLLIQQPTQQKQKIKTNLTTNPKNNQQQKQKKKQLNYRIFNLKKGPMYFLYFFNLLFNTGFRLGLIALLVFMFLFGDGDTNQRQQQIFVSVLLGLEGIVALLYFLAITKILYTKSSDISVYFQKQFYEKPYAEIHMQRILRKHFTLRKIISNLCRLANPKTKFSKDLKISVLRQEIYKRIEFVFVFMPLLGSFISGLKWFDKTEQIKFDVQLLIAIVACMEAAHLMIHYLVIYIFS